MSDGRPPADEPGPEPAEEPSWPAEPADPGPSGEPWPSRIDPGDELPAADDEEAPWPPPRPDQGPDGDPDPTSEEQPPAGAHSDPADHAPPADDGPQRRDAGQAPRARTPPGDDPEPLPPAAGSASLPSDGGEDDDDLDPPWPARPAHAAAAGPTPLRPLQPRRPRAAPTEAEPLDDDEAWDDEPEPAATRGGRPPRRASPARRLAALALGLAAAVLYLGDAWWQSTAPGFAELVRIEHLPLPDELGQDAADPALDLRVQGLTAYGQGRWQQAEQALARAAPLLADRHPELGLYLASTLLHLERFEDAEVEALAAAGPGQLQGEAWWLAIQARLSQQPPDLAGSYELLGQIIDQELDRASDARRLRQALDELR